MENTSTVIFLDYFENLDRIAPIVRRICSGLKHKPLIVSSNFARPKQTAEIVGKEAANSLIKEIESKAPVDRPLADQILPFMALTKGSKIKVSELTSHCKTNMYIVEQFLGVIFAVNEKEKIIAIKQ